VSRQTINAVETDKYDPSLPLALRLAQLFGVNPQDIFLDDWVPETLTEDMLCAR
jgi:putative transcriptional regulator